MAESRTTLSEPGRMILGLMVFTMVFAMVGAELEKNTGGPGAGASPAKIIFGGTVATSALTLLSHAGEAGEHFAVGLATIAFTTSALVYGKPVWDRLNKQFGTKPTGATSAGAATTPTTPTTMATEQVVPLVATTALA
jgi:hypothetical protein